MRVYVAGATGVIGQFLVPGLISAGHEVTASTRSPAKAGQLTAQGAKPVSTLHMKPISTLHMEPFEQPEADQAVQNEKDRDHQVKQPRHDQNEQARNHGHDW